jgi:hypothetical protein
VRTGLCSSAPTLPVPATPCGRPAGERAFADRARAPRTSARLACRVAISSVAVKSSPQPREWGRRQSQARGLADARYIGACIPVIIVRQCGPPSN